MANEKRLIDANGLALEFIARFCGNGTELSPDAQFEIKSMINHAPTVDAIEVCRCKDCKWYRYSRIFIGEKFCFRLMHPDSDKRVGYNFAPDDFCSYGEKREVE